MGPKLGIHPYCNPNANGVLQLLVMHPEAFEADGNTYIDLPVTSAVLAMEMKRCTCDISSLLTAQYQIASPLIEDEYEHRICTRLLYSITSVG